MCVILPAMREDRWLVPEGPANRLQCVVVQLFVEIDRYLERYTKWTLTYYVRILA